MVSHGERVVSECHFVGDFLLLDTLTQIIIEDTLVSRVLFSFIFSKRLLGLSTISQTCDMGMESG